MKRFLINILLFFAFVAVVDMVYGYACNYMVKHAHSGETARAMGVFKQGRFDLMAMGSSRCVCHYDDQLLSDSLGINAINVGNKGNGIVLMYGRYHIIPKENKPKVLLYDIEPSFDIIEYENDDKNRRYLSGLKMFYNEPGIRTIFKDVDCSEPIKMYSQMYRYNSKTLVLLGDYMRKGRLNLSFYLPTHRRYVAAEVKEKPSRNNDLLKLKYFEKLIEETRADGVQLVVIASPKYGASSTDELQPIMELCSKHSVPFWDYYLDMHDTEWFCDNMHLNYEGSQEFTKTIFRRIANENLINKDENTKE
ncbi:MAG: hypothetical protein IKQ09_01525 [Bacteroidales bacterium]|nr:hypothetical protein [Bacteroidales bacterium]